LSFDEERYMSEEVDPGRCRFLSAAVMMVAAAQFNGVALIESWGRF